MGRRGQRVTVPQGVGAGKDVTVSQGQQKLGKYTLTRKLAQGGMAEIFLASQEGPGGFHKELVIKRILPHLADDKKFVEMFLDEARIAAQFNHPNIAQIFDLGEVEGAYFIAIEFVDGYDLSNIIERLNHFGKRVPSPIAARIISDALGGLGYAHEFKDPRTGEDLNLVHRDISPQNILVNRNGQTKLVDFGVAKAKNSSNKTQAGAVKGKFCYMAPEQIAGEALDGRCDVFAMGIVLYELLLGMRPFGEHSDLLAITAIVNQPPKNPREIDSNFPPELAEILNRALAKRPAERYPDAQAMQADLERFLQQSGKFISSREVARYLEDLFSDTPSADALGLGAGHTHDFSLDELKKASQQVPKAQVAGAAAGFDDEAATAGKSNTLLMVVLFVVLLAVLAGGGFLAYVLFFDASSTESGATAKASDPATAADPDAGGAEHDADPTVTDEADGHSGGAAAVAGGQEADVDPATGDDAGEQVGAADVAQADAGQAGAGSETSPDVVETPPQKKEPRLIGESEGGVVVHQVGVRSDIDKLPKDDQKAGYGVLRIKSNQPARAHLQGQRINIGPAARNFSFPAGDYELRLVGRDVKAEKLYALPVHDGRRYELELNFEKATLDIAVEGDPLGYTVLIDGNAVGALPVTGLELWEGSHEMTITYGDKRWVKTVVLQGGHNSRTLAF